MNRIRLIFLLFLALFVGLISLLTLTYFEHEKIAKYGGVARELGHEVLEMRDQITSNAIAGISNPYQLSASLVNLEKELQKLKKSYHNTNIHSSLFSGLPTEQLLEN